MFIATLPPVSNRATWIESVELRDAKTGDLIDLSAVDEITVEVRDLGEDGTTVLSATLSDATVAVLELGIFEFRFTAAQVTVLCNNAYDVGCTIEQDDETAQLLIGVVPILDGVVRP